MKYTTKTAIEIMTEEDRLEVIPFLESLGGVNYLRLQHPLGIDWDGVKVYICPTDNCIQEYVFDREGYTIIKGVPKDWREESENNAVLVVGAESYPKALEIIIEEQKQKLDQLESENKELRELLAYYVNFGSLDSLSAEMDSKTRNKAKQLLSK